MGRGYTKRTRPRRSSTSSRTARSLRHLARCRVLRPRGIRRVVVETASPAGQRPEGRERAAREPRRSSSQERHHPLRSHLQRQFAELLDFYAIEWDYEPTSFDLEWNREGRVLQRFTPDFYLPEFDLYIEITTLSQKLVTKKNRKVRRLRERYPEVTCKIFYQRDYLSLVTKYGLEDALRHVGTDAGRPRRVVTASRSVH